MTRRAFWSWTWMMPYSDNVRIDRRVPQARFPESGCGPNSKEGQGRPAVVCPALSFFTERGPSALPVWRFFIGRMPPRCSRRLRAPIGAPAEAQRSGFGGERRGSEMAELSAKLEAKDMELAPTLSRCEPARTLARFHSASAWSGAALPPCARPRSAPSSLAVRFSALSSSRSAWLSRW